MRASSSAAWRWPASAAERQSCSADLLLSALPAAIKPIPRMNATFGSALFASARMAAISANCCVRAARTAAARRGWSPAAELRNAAWSMSKMRVDPNAGLLTHCGN